VAALRFNYFAALRNPVFKLLRPFSIVVLLWLFILEWLQIRSFFPDSDQEALKVKKEPFIHSF